jgi:hypothetical protein
MGFNSGLKGLNVRIADNCGPMHELDRMGRLILYDSSHYCRLHGAQSLFYVLLVFPT